MVEKIKEFGSKIASYFHFIIDWLYVVDDWIQKMLKKHEEMHPDYKPSKSDDKNTVSK